MTATSSSCWAPAFYPSCATSRRRIRGKWWRARPAVREPVSWQALAEDARDLAGFGAKGLHDRVAYLSALKPDAAPVSIQLAGGTLAATCRPPGSAGHSP